MSDGKKTTVNIPTLDEIDYPNLKPRFRPQQNNTVGQSDQKSPSLQDILDKQRIQKAQRVQDSLDQRELEKMRQDDELADIEIETKAMKKKIELVELQQQKKKLSRELEEIDADIPIYSEQDGTAEAPSGSPQAQKIAHQQMDPGVLDAIKSLPENERRAALDGYLKMKTFGKDSQFMISESISALGRQMTPAQQAQAAQDPLAIFSQVLVILDQLDARQAKKLAEIAPSASAPAANAPQSFGDKILGKIMEKGEERLLEMFIPSQAQQTQPLPQAQPETSNLKIRIDKDYSMLIPNELNWDQAMTIQGKIDKRVDKNKADARWDKVIDRTFDEVIKPNAETIKDLLQKVTANVNIGKPKQPQPAQIQMRVQNPQQQQQESPAVEPAIFSCPRCKTEIDVSANPIAFQCPNCKVSYGKKEEPQTSVPTQPIETTVSPNP